jgi:AraC family transcriptional regulator
VIKVRIEEKPAFQIIGRKTWIGGTDDEATFGRFWERCKQDGLLFVLDAIRGGRKPGPLTNGIYLGVSRVEKDPSNRSFFFYVGIESGTKPAEHRLEEVHVPASKWAVFENQGPMPQALVAAEMYAFTEWLPSSSYVHAKVPEMEVYPPGDAPQGSTPVEFWLPIAEKATAY